MYIFCFRKTIQFLNYRVDKLKDERKKYHDTLNYYNRCGLFVSEQKDLDKNRTGSSTISTSSATTSSRASSITSGNSTPDIR